MSQANALDNVISFFNPQAGEACACSAGPRSGPQL